MPDTLREKVARILCETDMVCTGQTWEDLDDADHERWYIEADRILSLTEADAREREKKAFVDGVMACLTGDAEDEDDANRLAARRYGGK